MPLTGSGAILGAAIAAAGGIVDPAGLTKSGGLAGAICSWIASNAIVTNIPSFGTLTASGTSVTGAGRIDFSADGNAFGDALAASIPATDPQGIVKWRAIANALHSHIKTHGRANPTAYVANPVGGAVTGTGTLSFVSSVFSPTLASTLGLVDAANQATWLALGVVLLTHLATNALVNATGFSSPPGGGPLTGASLIS
jgi:hypothetical protein